MNLRQSGIGEILGNSNRVLVAQKLSISEDESETLGIGLSEPGAEVLGGHGNREIRGSLIDERSIDELN
jgi:hypothetical protein